MAITQMIRIVASTMLLASSLLLPACSGSADKPAAAALEAVPVEAAPAKVQTAPPGVTVPVAKPSTPRLPAGQDTGLACKTNADCAVKDAGSCCGFRPVCVNKDTPTFPEKVKAACSNEGRVGICGFQAIDGCQCVSGKCEGLLMMENSAPVQ